MANLTSQTSLPKMAGTGPIEDPVAYPIAADAVVYRGGLVGLYTSGPKAGYLDEYIAGQSQVIVGVCNVGSNGGVYDNTGGSNGGPLIPVAIGTFWLQNSGTDAVARANIPCVVYAQDDHTVALTSNTGTRSILGIATAVDAALGVKVEVRATLNGVLTAVPTLAVPLAVASGGTGRTSLTAYAPLFGGTTSTGAVQSGTVGTASQVLMSNGAAALPTMQFIAPASLATAADGVSGVEFVITKDIATATASTDIAVGEKCELIGIQVFKDANAGGAGDTVQVKTNGGTTAITDAMSLNVGAKAVVNPATVDTAHTTFAANESVRVACATVTNSACRVVLRFKRVA